jgi:uncharacterized protein YndB with AHSA1/START domain/DNA-binding transcriptional ArsR family regulator
MVTLSHKQRGSVFQAIADPTRREILGLLRGGRYTVGEIAANFRTSRPAISKHLRVLQSAGLVVAKPDGTARICELNAAPLRNVSEWLQDYEALWSESLGGLKRYVEEKPMKLADESNTIIQEIIISAPAERVFDALTDPSQRVAWWGNEGRFRTTYMESDLHPGGKWMMRGMGMGKPFSVYGEYRTIERPRLLVFTWLPSWQDDATESLVRFDLEERDGRTTVRLTHSGLTGSGRAQHKGWPQILAWLQAYVEA